MEDAQILELFRQRSPEALTQAELKYGRLCMRLAENLLQSRADAEECVNDALFVAWEHIPPDAPAHFDAYLLRVTRQVVCNRFRKNTAARRDERQTVPLEELELYLFDPQTTENLLDAKELTRQLEQFLSTRSPVEQAVFMRRYWYMEPLKQIAADYSLSESKVKSMLFRLRGKLRTHLQQQNLL